MKITISGTPGSGKTTVGKMLAKELGYNYYDAGQVRREIAEKHGLTIHQLNKIGETEDWTDKQADDLTKNIGTAQDNFVFVGWIAYHFIPDSIKIFMKCDDEEAAHRIMNDVTREKERYDTLAEAKEKLHERLEGSRQRYIKYYDIDFLKASYDIIIDTTHLTPEKVLEKIKEGIQ